MPPLHSLSCKILSCLGAYYSQAQAGPAHDCLAVAIMFRNQLTTPEILFIYRAWPFAVANFHLRLRIKQPRTLALPGIAMSARLSAIFGED